MSLMLKCYRAYSSKHVENSRDIWRWRLLHKGVSRCNTDQASYAACPSKRRAVFWENGHPRNLAVGCQKLYGSNKKWKKPYGYHKRSLSETAMYRVKQLLGGRLSLRNYNAQVGETYAIIKALNKLTGLGMPNTLCVV